MSAPQLTDANTSSEWIRTVAEAAGSNKPRSPSQVSIADGANVAAGARRKHFVRLVTYTMVGLVGFTLLGVASFSWRQHAMRSALAAPAPAALPAPAAPSPATAPAAPNPETAAAVDVPAPAAPAAAETPARKVAAPKAAKKTVKRSPFLSTKPATKTAKR